MIDSDLALRRDNYESLLKAGAGKNHHRIKLYLLRARSDHMSYNIKVLYLKTLTY
jgi:hypothetical protein